MAESNTADTRASDAARARELLLRAATHNFGSSLRNDLVAEAAVWAGLYQAGVMEETTQLNGNTASGLGSTLQGLSDAIRELGGAVNRRTGGPARPPASGGGAASR